MSVFGPTLTSIYPEIENSQPAIQISQNQSSISFQLSMKTIITFWSIWTYFGYGWIMIPGPKIERSQLRLEPFFQKPLIIASDHFLTLDLLLKATPTGWKESIGFPDIEHYSFNKKSFKKIKYSRSSPSCYWVVFFYFFWLTQKERFLKPIKKKNSLSRVSNHRTILVITNFILL